MQFGGLKGLVRLQDSGCMVQDLGLGTQGLGLIRFLYMRPTVVISVYMWLLRRVIWRVWFRLALAAKRLRFRV